MAEATTNSTQKTRANVDSTDQVVNALMGLDENDDTVQTETDEFDDVEGLSDDSTQEVDESDEEESEDSDTEEDEDTDETEEDEDDSDEDDSETDEGDPETWAQALGVDEDQLEIDENGNLKGVKVKIEGVASVVDMPTLIRGYQTDKTNTKRSQALADERKTFESARTEAVSTYKNKIEDLGKLTTIMHNNLLSDFQGIDWDKLRSSDPAEWTAMNQEYQARQSEIQRVYQALDQERKEVEGTIQEERVNKRKEFVKAQLDKTIEKFPEWKDPKVLESNIKSMTDFVTEAYGFTPEEFNANFDARLVDLISDAQKFRKGMKAVENKIPKNKLPKFKKGSGRKRTKPASKVQKLTQQANRAKGNEKRDYQSSAIGELLINGE